MVTASVHNRFKNKATMNESYIERYIQAKRRNEVIPKCLFGAPTESESERFLFEQGELEVANENQRVLDKYDLTDVPTNVLAEFQMSVSPEPENASLSISNSEVGEGFKFQPRIITEDNPPPRENLFSPIDKIEFTPSSRTKEAETTDYWQTSKRRRSSSRSDSSVTEIDSSVSSDLTSQQRTQLPKNTEPLTERSEDHSPTDEQNLNCTEFKIDDKTQM